MIYKPIHPLTYLPTHQPIQTQNTYYSYCPYLLLHTITSPNPNSKKVVHLAYYILLLTLIRWLYQFFILLIHPSSSYSPLLYFYLYYITLSTSCQSLQSIINKTFTITNTLPFPFPLKTNYPHVYGFFI
uniref:Uncharacterized protein n=1 Tax=Siphoviridae sp. ctnpt50 TaxID=2827941 RepID=A0A8S5SDL4_9CAUD|nr:MAG TPA: hypothetical protein [Siphoviridae sp. ctnpt50]